jgi:hypothetical protein
MALAFYRDHVELRLRYAPCVQEPEQAGQHGLADAAPVIAGQEVEGIDAIIDGVSETHDGAMVAGDQQQTVAVQGSPPPQLRLGNLEPIRCCAEQGSVGVPVGLDVNLGNRRQVLDGGSADLSRVHRLAPSIGWPTASPGKAPRPASFVAQAHHGVTWPRPFMLHGRHLADRPGGR